MSDKKFLFSCALIAAIICSGFQLYNNWHLEQESKSFGAIQIPEAPSDFITTLQSSIGTSDTSMTLNAGTLSDGTTLTGYQCFTLDAGTASAEYTCGTASGTAISNLLRGINPTNPAATSTALVYSHRRGADVRITDFPVLQIIKRLVNGQDSFPNALSLDSGVATSSFTTYDMVTKQYADGIALQGAPSATTTVQGLVQAATIAQIANGVQNGSTGAVLFAPGNLYASTSPGSQKIAVTQTNGKLNQNFYDLTQAFTFTGNLTNTATTTLAATTTSPLVLDTVNYVYPNTQGLASTTLVNNGSGVLTSTPLPFTTFVSTTITATTTLGQTTSSTIASLSITLAKPSRLLTSGIFSFYNSANATDGCQAEVYVDNVLQSSVSKWVLGVNGDWVETPGNFTYITSQLTAATHTINLTAKVLVGGTCVIDNAGQFTANNLGN